MTVQLVRNLDRLFGTVTAGLTPRIKLTARRFTTAPRGSR